MPLSKLFLNLISLKIKLNIKVFLKMLKIYQLFEWRQ